MRRASPLTLFALAAACWLAAGPGGVMVQALLACRHHAAHQSHPGHGGEAPANAPRFCGEMTGGLDLAVSTAVATPATPDVTLVPRMAEPAAVTLFPLPPSPAFAPTPPPPNRLG